MELRHLRHFIAVAEELHFARAAERVGIEQSPLSQSIRNLETDLGVKLFHRTTRRTWLTCEGKRFYAEAKRILDSVETAREVVRHIGRQDATRLSLGFAEYAASEPVTRFVSELVHRRPTLTIEMREIASEEAVGLVEDRVLDLAVLHDRIDRPGLKRVRGWATPLMLLVPIGHPFAKKDRVEVSAVTGHPVCWPHRQSGPGFDAQMHELLDRYCVRPARQLMVKHVSTAITYVATGRALALLPDCLATTQTVVVSVPLAEKDAEVVSWLLYREDDPSDAVSLALEVAAFLDHGDDLSEEANGS